jgi:hypothetical protein
MPTTLPGIAGSAAAHAATAIEMRPMTAQHAQFQACFDACADMVRAHRPDLGERLPPELENRLHDNVAKLIERGYDRPQLIRDFVDQCLHHDVRAAVVKTLGVELPPNVANFVGMHDPALLGADTAKGTLSQIGLHLGAVLGAVDIASSYLLGGALDHLAYHKPDPHCVDKLLDPNFRPDPAADRQRGATQGALLSGIKNSLRIPAAWLAAPFGVVNTNNNPVVRPGHPTVPAGNAGPTDNMFDSLGPVILKPIATALQHQHLTPAYKASLMLSDRLDHAVDKANATWGQALKTGLWDAGRGAANGLLQLAKPTHLLPAAATVALVAKVVENVINTNVNINEDGRRAWEQSHNVTLAPGMVPASAYATSRANSTAAFAGLAFMAPYVHAASSWLIDKAVEKGVKAWEAYRATRPGPAPAAGGPSDEAALRGLLGGEPPVYQPVVRE